MALFKGKKEEDKKGLKKNSSPIQGGHSKADQSKTGKPSMKDLYKGEKKAKTLAKTDEKAVASKRMAYKILIKPLITEKAASMSSESKYVFEVSRDANKIEIADAILEVYGVKPVAINVANFKGKKVGYGQKVGRRKSWRKAVVTLEKGETINIYEGV